MWLRWPRVADAPAIHRFCSRWEVARYTARIPHPYPPGSAERFIYAAREANASGRDLTLVLTPIKGKRDAVGSISLEVARHRPADARLCARARSLGQGSGDRGGAGRWSKPGFTLTPAIEILASARIENPASRRVLEKCGFELAATGLEGAPARGGLVECHRFRL